MTMPIVGEPFNPWHEACGFWPEDVVDRQRGLGDGPKRAYRRLKRFAGVKGSCFPSQETLAGELGKGERQVRRDLDALEAAGLIASLSRDGRRSNTYIEPIGPRLSRWCRVSRRHTCGTPRSLQGRFSTACCGLALCTTSRSFGIRAEPFSRERLIGSRMNHAGLCEKRTPHGMGRRAKTQRCGIRPRRNSSWVDRTNKNTIIQRKNQSSSCVGRFSTTSNVGNSFTTHFWEAARRLRQAN